MAEQLDIDFSKRVRIDDPETSKAAAAAAAEFAREHHTKIVDVLTIIGPGTIYEIGELADLDHVAVARRMKELEEAGRVERTGLKRNSPSGRPCMVWRAKK